MFPDLCWPNFLAALQHFFFFDGWCLRGSVQKVAHAGEDHGHAEAVRGLHHVVVAYRAAC